MDDFVAELGAREVVKAVSRAMAGYQIVRIDFLQRGDDPADVGVVERRNDVETADDGMNLLHPGDRLRLPDGIDNAAVAAGRQHDKALALDEEIGADLVLKIVGDESTGIFRRLHPIRKASQAIDDADLLFGRL